MAKLIIKILHVYVIFYVLLYKNYNVVCSIIGFEEVEEKSSHYGLYMLGFTCATRVETKRSYCSR
jgi:hypothetical protein